MSFQTVISFFEKGEPFSFSLCLSPVWIHNNMLYWPEQYFKTFTNIHDLN